MRINALLVFVIASLLIPQGIYAQEGYAPSKLLFTLFADGAVTVDLTLDTDITTPTIVVPLFGSTYEKLIILDAGGVPLSYTVGQAGVTVNTLGTERVSISYETFDLTNKTGRIWTFKVETPIDSLIALPEAATILSLNQPPTAISTLGSRVALTMPAGVTSVTYILGILATKEHALALIADAKLITSQLVAKGVIVTDALRMIGLAEQALQQAEFAKAEELASNATALAKQIGEAASGASLVITQARSAITRSLDEGRTVGLSEAQKLLSEAEDRYRNGQYSNSRDLALQAIRLANDARAPPTSAPPAGTLLLPLEAILGVTAAAAIVAGVFLILRRKGRGQRPSQPGVQKLVRSIDVQRILAEKPNLRPDDQDVIRYLAEVGGEAFEGEIKERFQLPRTTVWRMVKRLANEEIVQILNVRGQNLVRIHERYGSKR